MHIHIVGICGTFMGGVAQLAKQAGHRVTGCDRAVYPPMSDALRAAGIDLIEGFGLEQLDLQPDVWVIGNAISRGNPLLEEILNRRLPYTSGPQWLSENILQGRRVCAVAGTHGKTTTTSLVTWILQQTGRNPGYLIGGVPAWGDASARLGDLDAPFVIEADEYDTCFFDKRSKFVHYRPTVAILNNLEYDHADIFENLAAIETQFHHLVRIMPSAGRVIYHSETPSLRRVLARGVWTPIQSFGTTGDWVITDHNRVFYHERAQGKLSLPMPGRYNARNALAAIAAARYFGVTVERSLRALAFFPGVHRRQEVKGIVRDITVMDDFAHHPTAIVKTIDAVKAQMRKGRLFAIFEPRSNTMKLGTMKAALRESFHGADWVFAYQGGNVSWSIEQALAGIQDHLTVSTDIDALVDAIVEKAQPGDVLLCMSNGAFGGIHAKLLQKLAR